MSHTYHHTINLMTIREALQTHQVLSLRYTFPLMYGVIMPEALVTEAKPFGD